MFIKKLSVLTLAATFLLTPSVADARFDWKGLGRDMSREIQKRVQDRDHVTVKKNMIIDGNYISANYDASRIKNSDIPIVVYRTRVEEPVMVNWHFISNGDAAFSFRFYDSHGQELVYENAYNNSTKDAFVVLEPGDYELKIHCWGNGTGMYRFKGNQRSVNTNVASDLSFVDDAGYLTNGVTAINYFASTKYHQNRFHYYTFNVPYTGNVSIVGIPYVNNILEFEILDADQVRVKGMNIYDTESKRMNLYLRPGKYYIRVGVNHKMGAVYGVKVE